MLEGDDVESGVIIGGGGDPGPESEGELEFESVADKEAVVA